MIQRVPRVFEKYGERQGAHGHALIQLTCKGSTSRTAISRLDIKAPLLVQRALYPDPALPGMAHLYLMSSAGGILQGDRLQVELDAGEGTMSRTTTQSATKIYRMDSGYASQRVTIVARTGSYVEFIPHQLIPFRSSRFFQEVDISASEGSTVVYSETVSAGRLGSGERFDFDVCFLRTRASDSKNTLLFTDACNIAPSASGKPDLKQLFGGRNIWSSIYIVTPGGDGELNEVMDIIRKSPILAGCSALPNDSGLVVRILDDSLARIESLAASVVSEVRSTVTRRASK